MKNLSLVFILLCTANISDAQLISKFSKSHPIKTANWGSQASIYIDGYLDMARVEIGKSFTKALADSIVKRCSPYDWPPKWAIVAKDKLKIYKIGEFNNTFRGKFHGVQYILWIPASENKILWEGDDRFKPYDFFVLMPKEAITL